MDLNERYLRIIYFTVRINILFIVREVIVLIIFNVRFRMS